MTAIDFDTYTITVKGVGNYKDTASVKWKIKDENPPTGELAIDQNKWEQFQPDATFGRFSRETQTVTIHASDDGSGVDKVYYYNSNEILSLDEVKALAEEKWTAIQNGDSYDIEAENKYVVYVKITDKSGNVTYLSSDGFVIDKTAPEIIGVKDQGVYCEAVTLTAADNKAHTIIAADKAGNTTTVQVTVYNGHSWKEPAFTWSADYTGATAVFTCANDACHEKTETCTVKTEVIKQATGAEKGEITVTATVTVDGKTYQSTKKKETMIAGSEEVGSNGGKITTEIIVSEDMPKTEINNLTVETAKSLLSQEEQTQVENGAEVIIYLEANSLDAGAVSKDDKSCVESQLDSIVKQLNSKNEVKTGSQYIDLSLYKKIGSAVPTKLESSGQNELEVTVHIPDHLKSANSKRTYYVIRVHKTGTDTLVDTLTTTKSGDTLTFKTDRFSTYAIVYAEPQDTSSGGNSGGNSGGSSGGGNSGGASATPEQPGDTGKTDDTEKPSETPDSGDQSDFSGNQVSKLTLPILLAQGKGGDKKIFISWNAYEGADGYDCYWSYCNGKQNYKKFTSANAATYRATSRHLNNNRRYKYFVAAYKLVDGKKVYIAKSNPLHVALKNARTTNAKAVTVNQTTVTLKAGQTFVIKSRTKLENANKKELHHVAAYRYYTSDQNVASVSKNGQIKAVKAGTCVIYVLANNGVYGKIEVTVN